MFCYVYEFIYISQRDSCAKKVYKVYSHEREAHVLQDYLEKLGLLVPCTNTSKYNRIILLLIKNMCRSMLNYRIRIMQKLQK